jgi:hypothetical protein
MVKIFKLKVVKRKVGILHCICIHCKFRWVMEQAQAPFVGFYRSLMSMNYICPRCGIHLMDV